MQEFKCKECAKECQELVSLSQYGQRAYGTEDGREYCAECFDLKFGVKDDKDE